MAQSLQDELISIFERLTIALVEATPEWWTSAELELAIPDTGFGSGLTHHIRNNEFPRDMVVATDEVFEATRALELASIRHDDTWQRCVFRIAQEPSGEWRFAAEFER